MRKEAEISLRIDQTRQSLVCNVHINEELFLCDGHKPPSLPSGGGCFSQIAPFDVFVLKTKEV